MCKHTVPHQRRVRERIPASLTKALGTALPASSEDCRTGLAGTSGGDYKVELLPKAKHCAGSAAATQRPVWGGANLGVGTHIVRCAKPATKVSLYVDTVLNASQTVKVGSISNSQPVILAAKPVDDFTKGLIDYIKIS